MGWYKVELRFETFGISGAGGSGTGLALRITSADFFLMVEAVEELRDVAFGRPIALTELDALRDKAKDWPKSALLSLLVDFEVVMKLLGAGY